MRYTNRRILYVYYFNKISLIHLVGGSEGQASEWGRALLISLFMIVHVNTDNGSSFPLFMQKTKKRSESLNNGET